MSGKYKFLRKRLCVAGLVAASVFAGVAAPLAVGITNTDSVLAVDDYPSEYKNYNLDAKVDRWNFYNRECTSFVAWCLNSRNGVNFHNYYQNVHWGNASNWGAAARKVGIAVDNNPAPGSVYWQTSGKYGHVAWVKEVSGDNVYIEWYSTNRDGKYHEGWVKKSSANGYIHIKDLNPYNYWPIEHGYYTIKTAVGNRFLNVSGMGTADRTNVQIWDAYGAHSGQIFRVGKNSMGTGYFLENLNSKTFVDTTISGRNQANPVGADNVMIFHGDGTDGQQWRLEDAGNGNFFIKNLYGYYLDVCDGANNNGTNVGTWKKNGSAAQQWKFTRVSGKNLANIADGDYMIYSKVGNRVLNAAGDRTGNGTNLQLWDPLDVNGNVFTTQKDGRFVTKIRNKAANRMVDSQGGTNAPENVQLWDYNNGYGQNWYVEDAGDGYVYIRNLWGYYLDVNGGVNANGTNVKTWHFNGSDAQKWKFVKYTKTNVTGVSLNTNSQTAEPNSAFMLYATVSPNNATNKKVIWSSSNTNVATVDASGIVATKNPGTTQITAKTEDGGKTATCTVTVKAKDTRTGLYKVGDSWLYLKNGVQDKSFTGLAKNQNGWWYVNKGKVDYTYTGLAKNQNGWWYVNKGKVDYTYTGLAKNQNGWWYVNKGKVDYSYTGLAKNQNGWWYACTS